jgi:hypothetical protein
MVQTRENRSIGKNGSVCHFAHLSCHMVWEGGQTAVTAVMCNFKVGFFFRNLSGGGEKTKDVKQNIWYSVGQASPRHLCNLQMEDNR